MASGAPSEFDNGQFELTMRFDTAVKACDDAFLMRTMAREIGLKKGLLPIWRNTRLRGW